MNDCDRDNEQHRNDENSQSEVGAHVFCVREVISDREENKCDGDFMTVNVFVLYGKKGEEM